jgi:hypothetical protein
MTPITVTLTGNEMYHGATCGVLRRLTSQRAGLRDRWGLDGEGYTRDIHGALAELAVAKYLGRYWTGINGRIKDDDVRGLQVRWTRWHCNRLLLHPDDADDTPYILVTGDPPDLVIRGWILGREGKLPAYWDDPTGTARPAFFVPQAALRDLSELPEEVTLCRMRL